VVEGAGALLVEEGGQRFGEGGLPRRAGGERWEGERRRGTASPCDHDPSKPSRVGESGGELLRGEREGGDHAEEEEA